MKLQTRKGYTRLIHGDGEFAIHRLIAVAEYGYDTVVDNEIHHESGVGWDNRPSNIRPIEPGEHTALHSAGRDNYANKDTPYRDEELMRELYVVRGLSTYDVADELDTSRATVIRWLDKHGIDRRSAGRPPGS